MQLTVNREFLGRHLFALLVFAGMGIWFGYDGFVRYPAMTAPALYESIESAKPPAEMTERKLQAFKQQKIATQNGLCVALLLVAAAVGAHLLCVSRLRFSFDESGFVWKGRKRSYGDIRSIDRSKWPTKGILALELADGKLRLDSWHHAGVAEFERQLPK